MSENVTLFESLAAALACPSTQPASPAIDDEPLRPSAVLVPLLRHAGQLHLLLQVRTHRVLAHKGQISFPGGVVEPQDSSREGTALREAEEEIGLAPRDVRVLGRLEDVRTLTGFLISPVVGGIPYPYPFRTSREEVAELLVVPCGIFYQARGRRRDTVVVGDQTLEVNGYPFEGHFIWGATARIAEMLIERIAPILAGAEEAM